MMMRRSRWGVAAAVVVLAACATGRPRVKDAETWRWVYSTGGIAGQRVTPESKQLQVVYQFRGDKVLGIYRNPGQPDTVHYTIQTGAGPAGQDLIHYSRPVGVLPPEDSVQYLRRVGHDTLLIGDRCADCYEHTFVRIR